MLEPKWLPTGYTFSSEFLPIVFPIFSISFRTLLRIFCVQRPNLSSGQRPCGSAILPLSQKVVFRLRETDIFFMDQANRLFRRRETPFFEINIRTCLVWPKSGWSDVTSQNGLPEKNMRSVYVKRCFFFSWNLIFEKRRSDRNCVWPTRNAIFP